MKIEKVLWYTLVCPECGAKITLSAEEYEKYKEETEDYGNTITCLEGEGDDKYEVEYINFNCPVCDHYIPVTLSDLDTDTYGFKCSENVTPFYGPREEMSIEDYLDKKFRGE